MAKSSNMSTSNQYVKYYITCTQNSQSIVNNTSNVTVTVHIYRTNTGYPTWGTGTMYVTINGTNYTQGITPSQVFDSSPVRVFSKTLDIAHNSDGTKTLAMSAYVTHDMFTSSSQSYSQTLTTIARKSTLSLSASSTAMGSAVTINISRASNNFTHTIKYTFGSSSETIATSVGTSYAWTIPLALASQIPKATSGVGTITLETYNGSTLLGSNSISFTATVPSTVVPSFTSIGVTRVDGTVPSAWGVYVKGKSKVTLSITGAAGSYGSTITSYSISGGGYSTTSSSFTTGFLNTTGTITFTATIKDSRGRSATKTTSISVIDYNPPNISAFSGFRANSSGTALDTGTYARCSATFSYSSVSSKNTISANVKYRKVGVTTWTTGSNIASGTPITTGGGTLSTDSSYEVLLSVADAFTTVTRTIVISTSSVALDFKKGGKGVAIGKVSETDNLFDIGWNTKVNGKIDVTSAVNATGGIGIGATGTLTLNTTQGTAIASNHKLQAPSMELRAEGTPYLDFTNENTSDYDARIILTEDDILNFQGARLNVDHGGVRANGWFTTLANVGWYNETWGGGWNMTDNTWIRSYGSKNVYVDKILRADGGIQVGENTNVVSSGSNTSGRWTRYYDGLQICYADFNIGDNIAFTTSSSGVFTNATHSSKSYTFPVTFTTSPIVIASGHSNGYLSSATGSITTTSFFGRLYAHSSITMQTVKFQYIAIGRWK